MIQKKSFDINFCISQVKNTQTLINSKRTDDAFIKIFDLAASKTTIPTEYHELKKRITLTRDQLFEKYKILYYEILDNLSVQITTRFNDMEKLQFVTLMDTSKFVTYSENFPTDALSNLKVCYPNLFTDFQRLKNELQLIYEDKQYRQMEPLNFMELLADNRNIFKEAYKLFCLIVTIPSTTVSVERSFPCLKRIKSYLRNTMTEDRLTSLSLIHI